MAKVEIYTARFCGFCAHATALLDSKRVEYDRSDVTFDPGLRSRMSERAGGRTSVPQIFIDGKHVGGCQELVALENAGKLDGLLGR